MTSNQRKNPRPYGKNEYIKNSHKIDQFKQGKEMLSQSEYSRDEIDRMKDWITFFRLYPSIFVEFWLDIPLYEYQRYWMNLMAQSTNFLAVASRGSAKSMMIGLLAIVKAILYPGIKITIAASTKKQAGLVISQHISPFKNQSVMLAREVETILMNGNDYKVVFHNGSVIEVVVAGSGGRGVRNSISVLEERRLIPNEIIDTILRPFSVTYRAPYMFKKEYEKLPPIEAQEFSITSSYYQSAEWYPEAKKLFKMMANGDADVNCITLDYLISIRHGTKTIKQIEKDKIKFDELSFLMEYGNIAPGGSSHAFYKLQMFPRVIKRGWRPSHDSFITSQKNPYDIKKKSDEKRIISCDLAMRGGRTNDLSVFTCARLTPTLKGWETEVTYQETFSGKNATIQALRIKQLVDEFDADIVILDIGAGGGGIPVFDILTLPTKDEEKMKEYEAYTVVNHYSIDKSLYEDMQNRTLGVNARPIVFPISATPQSNAQMSVKLRDRLKRKLLKFLCDDTTAEEYLINSGNKDVFDDSSDIRSYLLIPHINTSLMINECISLDMTSTQNGSFKLQEPSGMRKDRYSSLMYLNWYVGIMDSELLKQSGNEDEFEVLASLFYSG
jgi:hypothetical protein